MNSSKELLLEEGYTSEENLVRDISLLFAMSKVEKYTSECEFYKMKYKMTYTNFEKLLHNKKGTEVFDKEEALEDWEFSINALKWWGARTEELKNAEVA